MAQNGAAVKAGSLRIGLVEEVGIYLYGYTDDDDAPDLMISIGTFSIEAGDMLL